MRRALLKKVHACKSYQEGGGFSSFLFLLSVFFHTSIKGAGNIQSAPHSEDAPGNRHSGPGVRSALRSELGRKKSSLVSCIWQWLRSGCKSSDRSTMEEGDVPPFSAEDVLQRFVRARDVEKQGDVRRAAEIFYQGLGMLMELAAKAPSEEERQFFREEADAMICEYEKLSARLDIVEAEEERALADGGDEDMSDGEEYKGEDVRTRVSVPQESVGDHSTPRQVMFHDASYQIEDWDFPMRTVSAGDCVLRLPEDLSISVSEEELIEGLDSKCITRLQ